MGAKINYILVCDLGQRSAGDQRVFAILVFQCDRYGQHCDEVAIHGWGA
jgi:hypothetical protein